MASFTYIAQMVKGGPFLTGRVTGANQFEALERLVERKIPVVDLSDAVPKAPPLSKKKIKLADKVSFAERFEASLYLKMPIDRALLSAIGQQRGAKGGFFAMVGHPHRQADRPGDDPRQQRVAADAVARAD